MIVWNYNLEVCKVFIKNNSKRSSTIPKFSQCSNISADIVPVLPRFSKSGHTQVPSFAKVLTGLKVCNIQIIYFWPKKSRVQNLLCPKKAEREIIWYKRNWVTDKGEKYKDSVKTFSFKKGLCTKNVLSQINLGLMKI